ncbi:hypothetical protein [Lactobacillus equicursoris]|uniref:hypothetical protein n=1 Tax=Lactobacillus equicursoris TaxID=420645 RepID=UPI00242FFBF9|nr:hypothetical protein [Lactobacillus equicursoris]MDD6386119.1 hypothetical protein [Lactobacillus equicursoris]
MLEVPPSFCLPTKSDQTAFWQQTRKNTEKMWYSFSKKVLKKAVADVYYAVFTSEHNPSSTTEEC